MNGSNLLVGIFRNFGTMSKYKILAKSHSCVKVDNKKNTIDFQIKHQVRIAPK